jgi:hypothetical protein
MKTDFDALSVAARNLVNRNALHELWNSALNLEHWHFVAADHTQEAAPVVGTSDGKPYMFVFTDEQRATDFSASRAKKRGVEATAVFSMSVDDAVNFVNELRDQIHGIVMNPGEYGFSSEPAALLHMHGRFRQS